MEQNKTIEKIETKKYLISIIIPVLNEKQNIPLIHKGILSAWKNLQNKYDYEIIFINDGSEDNCGVIIENLAKNDAKIKYIEFSRNFGKEIAVSAGLHNSKGDAAIIIDADLQHPPELLPQFIEKWENGADVVIGTRKANHGETLAKKLGSFFFYKIMNLAGETKIIPNETDYRLLDKKVAIEFNRFTEKNRISRGLINWLGFKKDYIYFDADKRKNGKPGYDNLKLTHLAVSAIVNHSLFPLKFAGYLGIFITFISGLLGIFVFTEKYILNDPWSLKFSGTAILAIIILFLIGIVLISLGLSALYIANIHTEIINRPLYIVKKKNL